MAMQLSLNKVTGCDRLQLPLRLRHQCQGTAHLKWMSVVGVTLGQGIGWMTSTGSVYLDRPHGPPPMITHWELKRVNYMAREE
jgi:hypothetical protein